MAKVYLSSGSNQGDRLGWLVSATKLIDKHVGKVMLYSSVFESEPWGFNADTTFYNQVLMVEATLNPQQVLAELLETEIIMGRVRSGTTYTSRIIDIDILFYDHLMTSEGNLVIPHPLMHLRRFVLEPFAEIAPEWIHPGLGLSIAELLNKMDDKSYVSKVVDKAEFANSLITKFIS